MYFEHFSNRNNVELPSRATEDSAGYDFFIPFDVTIAPHSDYKFQTNVKIVKESNDPRWVFLLDVRSGHGTKQHLRLANTIGIVDKDYSGFEIGICFENPTDKAIVFHAGDRVCQGVFTNYFITSNDRPRSLQRIGGFGSTGK